MTVMILLKETTVTARVPLTMIMIMNMVSNRHQPDAMEISSLQAGLLRALVMQHRDTHQRRVVIILSSLLAVGFVWLQRSGSEKGHPAFVVKAEKAAGSAQQSHQQAGAGKWRSDQAIPAIKTLGRLATPMYESVTTTKQTRPWWQRIVMCDHGRDYCYYCYIPAR